jgi:hypothetical protein
MTRAGAIAALACVLAPAPTAARADDVDLGLVLMGVGSHVRPGDPTAILVRATSALTAPVQARIEWSVRNADGDTVRFTRDVALAPGAPTERWVYGVMPLITTSAQGCLDAVSAVRVVEVDEGRAVRVLGEKRIDGASGEEPAVGVETLDALIGIVGDGRAGLSAFATPSPNMQVPASMNELTRVARGIEPARMPDRWEGWSSFDTVVWTNAPVQNLGVEQARALLDWVRRGGNLVLVLPESGDPWGLAGARGRTALAEVLPARAERHDAIEVSRLMPVLARTGTLRNEAARTGIWTFPNDPGNGFVPILALPARIDARSGNVIADDGSLDGRAVAVRRPFGFGFVTVVGIDVDGLERRSLVAEGLPQADVFWNRILGRRADAPVPSEIDALAKAKRVDTRGGLVVSADGGKLVNGFVGLQSRAAIGVLGLLGAFALYWTFAAPVPWFALRRARKLQYAWLAYVAVAVGATAIAWLAIGAFELTTGRVQHLTFIDRVERPGAPEAERTTMRASAWFSAALPGYGTSKVELERSEGGAGSDLLWSWFPPPTGLQGGFPDTETYEVQAASPASYSLPARATSTVLAASWMGRAPAAWDGMPRAVEGGALRQDIEWGESPRIVLRGTLSHSLKLPLRDVILVHVTPFHTPDRRMQGTNPPIITPSDLPPSYARMARLAQWAPGERVDVAEVLYGEDVANSERRQARPAPARDTSNASAAGALRARYHDPVQQSGLSNFDPSAALTPMTRLEMLQFFSMLQPPEYLVDPSNPGPSWRGDAVRIERDFGRGLDLSRWWSQPCLLVIGRVDDEGVADVGMPFPFTIDGRVPSADGTTWVRVAFPLPQVPGALQPPPLRPGG